jgi:hypothetical protein
MLKNMHMGSTAKKTPNNSSFRWLAWLLLVAALALLIGTIWIESLGFGLANNPEGNSNEFIASVAVLGSGLGFALLGALIVSFHSDNRIGWLCSVIGVDLTLMIFTLSYAESGVVGGLPLPGLPFISWLSYLIPILMAISLFAMLPFWFPNGHFTSPAIGRVAAVMLVLIGVLVLLVALLPGPMLYNGMDSDLYVDNPFGWGVLPTSLGPALNSILSIMMITLSFIAIASLIFRWRRADREMRQQLKWFAYFLATAVSVQLLIELFGAFIYSAIFKSWIYVVIIWAVFLGFPTVIGIAVFKYRLYDIDLIIRRTLSYTLLTLLLALIYFGSVVLLQSLFSSLTGQESPIIIVISTLAIAAVFSPLREWTQSTIDRRFYRQKYDAEKSLAVFSAKARQEVNLDELTDELLHVIQETMQPEKMSLWLKETEQLGVEIDV